MKWSANALLLAAISRHRVAADAPVNPNKVVVHTLDSEGNSVTVEECITGNSKNNHLRTCGAQGGGDGGSGSPEGGGRGGQYTICPDGAGRETICSYDPESGDLVPTPSCLVADYVSGKCDPAKMGILENEVEDDDVLEARCVACHMNDQNPELNSVIKKFKEEKKRKKAAAAAAAAAAGSRKGLRDLQLVGDDTEDLVDTMYNLVLLIRWCDHSPTDKRHPNCPYTHPDEPWEGRCLPSEGDVEVLFNAVDGDPILAPSGSVKDCFRYNSYDRFNLESRICDWCDVPFTETYYADGNSGMTGLLGEAIRHCLDECQRQHDFGQFDLNEDNEMDAIAILHSGYGAEWAGEDCQKVDDNLTLDSYLDRIWSHKWEFLPEDHWTGLAGVTVKSYHISPALWGTCGCSIGRIGVICHETGHFFGLPDLYDGTQNYDTKTFGSGVGTTCLMGNSWGYSWDQYYPPMMSAWAKLRLGWADPVEITSSGTYSLTSAAIDPVVLAFVNPYNRKEYFLMENKQHHEFFERNIPQTGINIYHIDDDATHTDEGYPNSPDWPEEHYRVAVIQADGKYDLEHGLSFGDAGDVFHGAGADWWGPLGVGKGPQTRTEHPNTNWYSSGKLVDSGFRMFNISPTSYTMTFEVEIAPVTPPPTAAPTPSPVVATSAEARSADLDTNPVDFGGAETEPKGKTCAAKMDPCTRHNECCSNPPNMRCKLVKKLGYTACKPTDKKKKKKQKKMLLRKRIRERRRLMRKGEAKVQEAQEKAEREEGKLGQ